MPSTNKAISLLNVGSFTFLGHLVQENSFGGGHVMFKHKNSHHFLGAFRFWGCREMQYDPIGPITCLISAHGESTFWGSNKDFHVICSSMVK